jgi:diadenosine tetraphosphate (Ap4A) HIT family hydrolase
MVRLVPREIALAQIARERPPGTCLVCALRDGRAGKRHELALTRLTTTLLSRYPRRWGHVLVLVNAHATRFLDVADEAWSEASAQALKAARALERVLAPRRCYVASLGTTTEDAPMSSPHVHLHVLPIYDADDRPKRIFDGDAGVYAGDEEDWTALHERLLAVWHAT